jgi:hypothetical protein
VNISCNVLFGKLACCGQYDATHVVRYVRG